MENTALRNFLEIPYDQLEDMNLEAKQQRLERVDRGTIEEPGDGGVAAAGVAAGGGF